jgi:hypothetical protein
MARGASLSVSPVLKAKSPFERADEIQVFEEDGDWQNTRHDGLFECPISRTRVHGKLLPTTFLCSPESPASSY